MDFFQIVGLLWVLLWAVWMVPAYFAGRKIGRILGALLTVGLGVPLGPLAGALLLIWYVANLRNFREAEESRRIALMRPFRMNEFRALWDANSIGVPEMLEFAANLDEDRRTDEAVEVLDRALEFERDDADIWRRKARMHWRLGQKKLEAEAYARAEEIGLRSRRGPLD